MASFHYDIKCQFHIRLTSHIHFNKKVSKLILRRELTYSPILVCFHLAIYRLVKGQALRLFPVLELA